LPELVQLAEKYNAILYVDDAHGTGVLGKNGGGISEHFNCYSPNMIHMGTLSKAYGALGGFIATEKYVTDILKYTCSAYGFTSTIPPDQAYAIITAMDMIKNEPERRQQLWDNQRYFVEHVTKMGYHLLSTQTPIMPIHIGDERVCQELSSLLHNEGIHIDAIMYPAVKMHSSRLRVMVNAKHTKEQIDKLLSILDSYKHKITHPALNVS
jgi:glycine C-acetyltransferase